MRPSGDGAGADAGLCRPASVLDRAQSPLFDRFCVWKQAESAFRRLVWLKSGGYLVFDYTEALTVVDVNTGKFVGKRSLSETVFALNCEAAREIAAAAAPARRGRHRRHRLYRHGSR